MSGMAEVLAAHAPNGVSGYGFEYVLCKCDRTNWMKAHEFPEHQLAALTAAGFGPVKESGAVAPHLKKVRGELKSFGKNLDSWESQGHTTVTIRNLRQVVARMDAAIRGNVA